MAIVTIYAEEGGGYLFSYDGTYSLARAGTGGALEEYPGEDGSAAQFLYDGVHYISETFLAFDLSTVSGSATDASFYLFTEDGSDGSPSVEFRNYSWGTLSSADWVPGASLGSYTLLSTLAISSVVIDDYTEFPGESALLTAIDGGGTLEVVISLSSTRLGSALSGDGQEGCFFSTSDAAGTSSDPYLEITTESGSGIPIFMHHYKLMAATN